MPAQQPTLDGTLPTPTLDYHTWVDQIRPAFVAAARTGRRFTTYEIAKDAELPEPPNPRADWGNATQLFVREQLLEHCGFDRSLRPTGEHSAVSVWRGTRGTSRPHRLTGHDEAPPKRGQEREEDDSVRSPEQGSAAAGCALRPGRPSARSSQPTHA